MKKTFALMAVLMFCTVTSISAAAKHTLFRNGKSDYSIVLSPEASVSEKTAAKEFKEYVFQISGATLPIVGEKENEASKIAKSRRKGTLIFIGSSDEVTKVTGSTRPQAGDDGFTCESHGASIFIYGGSERGTMYGVYSFLEKNFGVKWFTPECTVVPKMKEWSFENFRYSETPALKYRFVQYNNANRNAAWMAHNRNNSAWVAETNEYGGISAYWSAHTSGVFVSAKDYFDEHPEYFSMHDGKRIPNGQLCLSNPDVLHICIEKMKKAIADNPLYWVYSMSQNDTFLPCECDDCKKLEEEYGGHSGAFLWFVNQVADAIKPIYPDKYIGTFAYQYTRHAPKNIVPRDNVVIRLCSIECDFSHPIAQTEYNKPFFTDLEDWSGLAPHLFIWDYVVNFNQYIAPFPNFGSLAQNIITFRDHNAIGVQEEADYQTDGGEFSEMKSWVLAKLLWNPEQDTKALVKEFIQGYYGPAAQKVQEYFDLCQSLVKDDTVMGEAFDQNHAIYNDEFIVKATGILEDAKTEVIGDEELTKRIDRVRAQVLFLRVMRTPDVCKADGSKDELVRIITEQGIRPREWQTLDAFLDSIK